MILGILGGVGSGKSTVARMLAGKGGLVVDADRMAREVLEEPGSREQLRRRFGDGVFRSDGTVDRRAIARCVFADRKELRWLEDLVHPRVVERIHALVTAHRREQPSGRLLVLDVPLLLDTSLHELCDALIFVDAPLEVRRKRVQPRGWEKGEIEAREAHQVSNETKRQAADCVIDNSGDPEETGRQVEACHARLKNKAHKRSAAALPPESAPKTTKPASGDVQ
jgi:dephospho-CoA kinase